MSTSNYYDLTSDNQPIGVMMRPDLRLQKVYYQAEPYWVVKDSHDQQYHQYNEQEFAILNWLDGQVSFAELRDKFERKFSPYRVSYRELTTLIREFFKKSVVVSTTGDNGLQLHEYSREKRRQKLQKKFKSALAIQCRGWDPARFMDATYPLVSWFFSKAMVRVNMVLVMSALAWLLYNYDEFLTRLPNLWSLFDGSNLILFGIVITVTKMLHELGHAYVHKRFGGECHEIGIMIFFFMPTMYCNTSDSWMLTDKWKRIAIGAGGVYVELVIFALATFTWWFTGIGLLQDISLNLMVVCSISAAFTNGNPLMRYDGYFALSDWLEIPNLSQRSSKEVRRLFLNKCLGVEREVDHWSSRYNKRVFLAYGLASFIYKVFLIVGVSYFLTQQFQFAGLANLGLVIAAISLIGLFTPPVKSMWDFFKQPGNAAHINKSRARLTFGAMAVLAIAIAVVPLPYYVPGECTVEMANQQTVYSSEGGRIEAIYARPGQWIEKDDLVVKLVDENLQEQALERESEIEELKLQLDFLRTPSQAEDSKSGDFQSENELLTTLRRLESELLILRKKEQSLLIRAPRSGMIFGVTIGDRQADTDDENLNRLYGNPLDESNVGAWLEPADQICRIGDDAEQEIILLVEQKQNGLVRAGQDVSILLMSLSNHRLQGRIKAVSLKDNGASDLPDAIYESSSSPMVEHVKQVADAEKRKDMQFKDGQTLSSSMVQATVELIDPPANPINFASVGKAKVHIGNRTFLWRIKRTIDEVFQRSF